MGGGGFWMIACACCVQAGPEPALPLMQAYVAVLSGRQAQQETGMQPRQAQAAPGSWAATQAHRAGRECRADLPEVEDQEAGRLGQGGSHLGGLVPAGACGASQ